MLMMTGVCNGMTAMMTHHTKNEFSAFMRCAVESASDKMFLQRVVPHHRKNQTFPSFLSTGTISDDVTLILSFLYPFSLGSRNSTTADVIQLLCTPEEGVYPSSLWALCVCVYNNSGDVYLF